MIIILKVLRIPKTKTILGIALIFGYLNLIQFTDSDFFISFFFNGFTFLGFQPVSFLAILGLLVLNVGSFRKILKNLFPEKSDNDIVQEREKMIEVFVLKFKDYQKDKLQKIVGQSNSFQVEAIIAAK